MKLCMPRSRKAVGVASLAFAAVLVAAASSARQPAGFVASRRSFLEQEPSETRERNVDWAVYGGAAGDHYSGLAQINRNNVKELAVAWMFDTGEEGGLQSSPLIVDGVLYGLTPTQKAFAVDATTGKLLWKFEPGIKGTQPDRGLAYWSNAEDQRILRA